MANWLKRKSFKRNQAGFTLVELMVSTVIASVAIAGVMTVFTNSVRSNSTSLKEIRLNQEMRAIMDIMVRDIRRAGYWSGANGDNPNPFTMGFEALQAFEGNTCILYSYDLGQNNVDDGLIENSDRQGFKLSADAVKIRQASADCDPVNDGSWATISDPNTVTFTDLQFNVIENACLNLTDNARSDCGIGPDPLNPLAPLANDVIARMMVVEITLDAQLVGDANTSDTLIERIVVRNTVTVVA